MADQSTPADRSDVQDPTRSYERAQPGAESGMGRMDNNVATPLNRPDRQGAPVKNAQDPTRQINGHEAVNDRANENPSASAGKNPSTDPLTARGRPPEQPGHSMKEEEPMGWDQAPTDIQNPEHQRHPRTEGKGGTPDAGEPDWDHRE